MLDGIEGVGLIAEAIAGIAVAICEAIVAGVQLLGIALALVAEILVAIFSRDRAAKIRTNRIERTERMKMRRTAALERFRARRRRRIQRAVHWTLVVVALAGCAWLFLRTRHPDEASDRARLAGPATAPGVREKKKSTWSFQLHFRKKKDEHPTD